MNWSQIDFYYAADDIVEKLIQENKEDKYSNDSWSTETIDGIKANVITFPLDENGKVSKGGTGGKIYYIRLPGDNIKTLVIRKQAKGDEEFETESENLLRSISFLSN